MQLGPADCALLVFLVSLLWLLWTFEISERPFFAVTGWCFVVGVASISAARVIESGRSWKSTDWEVVLLLALSVLVTWFATAFYGTIKPAFGGGSPTPAKLFLKDDNVIFRSKTLDVLIVEETEQGYYVANRNRESKTAIFIPRASVSTAEFVGSGK